MFNTKATNILTDKTVTIKSADLYTISNDMFVEHWDVVEATGFPNRRISVL
jgi:predicted SnoaL-like aldol condensation-catalyzing enzyme